MKSSQKQSRNNHRTAAIDTSAAEFFAEGRRQPPEPKPEELLRRWINLHCLEKLQKKLGVENGQFMENADIHGIVENVDKSLLARVVMDMAYGGDFRNPYTIVSAIEYDNAIFDKLTDYFQNNRPENWDLAFCELIAATTEWGYFYEQCDWRTNRKKAQEAFKLFVGGEVSATLHSQRLYTFFFHLFFGGSSCAATKVLSMSELKDHEAAQLMQGLIEKGKSGFFPWDFETYMSS